MNILVLNCGSSSVKFRLARVGPAAQCRTLAGGIVERVGGDASLTVREEGGASLTRPVEAPDHESAVRRAVRGLGIGLREGKASRWGRPDAVGHRVVHGGDRFAQPVRIDDAVIEGIEALRELAPILNTPNLAGIRAARRIMPPSVPEVAVFDTAFHATIPETAARYAIPYELSVRYGIRRYGFHGTSYRYVLGRYCEMTGTPPSQANAILFHLGNGCSACAVREGRSIDTSMGFTPLEGLVMGTRSGDVDPALVPFLSRRERLTEEEAERMLNERSGLLGVSGRSNDMRDLLAREREDPRARLAVEMFCHRARKYLGAYLALLGGADAVVFTGGIGEHAWQVRERICRDMEWCGLALNPDANREMSGGEGRISGGLSRIEAYVIPTDEEAVIALDTRECLLRSEEPGSASRSAS